MPMLMAKVLVAALAVVPMEVTLMETGEVPAEVVQIVALHGHHLPGLPAATLVLPVVAVVLVVGIAVALLMLQATELEVALVGVVLRPAATDHGIWVTLMETVLAPVVVVVAVTNMVQAAVEAPGPDPAAEESISFPFLEQ